MDLPRPLAVPQTAPPYDDEITSGGNGLLSPPRTESAAVTGAGPAPPGPAPQRDGSGWPSQFAQVLAETLAGSRPAAQLTPWTTEQARSRIRQLRPALTTADRPRVRRVMTSAPTAGVLEMTAVVGFGPRTRVLALRLERHPAGPRSRQERWRCTAIESA